MKQHKDIREILKRSGTAPTGICGFWRSRQVSRLCFSARLPAFKFLGGHLSRCGRFFGFLPLVMALAAVSGHRASRPFPRGCPRAVSSAAVLLTFNTLQLWEKSHCYSQERVTTPTYKACGRIRSSFSTALIKHASAHGRGRNRTHTIRLQLPIVQDPEPPRSTPRI